MREYFIKFEEDYDYPEYPDIEVQRLSTDEDCPDGLFSYLVYANSLAEAVEKAIEEYLDNIAIEKSIIPVFTLGD